MPPRKRPHPRSLDALFPKPKVRPVKRCPAGHRMGVDWRPVMGCKTCRDQAARADLAKRDLPPLPSAWPGGKVPAVLTMIETSTGRVIRHAIPPHLIAQKRAQDRARGRRRGRRI